MSVRLNLGRLMYRMAIKIAGIQPRADGAIQMFTNGVGTASGIDINPHTAMTISAVWNATTQIAGSFASMPVQIFEGDDDPGQGKIEVLSGPLVRMMQVEPNPEMTPPVFRETLQGHLLHWGNAFAEIERTQAGAPLALWPITPNRVKPFRRDDNSLWYAVKTPDGGEDTNIPARNMIHIPGLGFDGVVGYSVVSMARESYALAKAMEIFGATVFGNGGIPSGFLSTDKKMTDVAVQNLRQSFSDEHGGLSKANRIAILHDGLKWQQQTMNPENLQFLAGRQFSVEEIARWFNIPPHMIKHLERSTNNNIEHQGREYFTQTLMPWIAKWEYEFRRKLVAPARQMRTFFRFNVNELLRGDMLTRYKAYQIARNGGWMNADDICYAEDRNPLPKGQGKYYLIPENYQAVEQLELEIKAGLPTEPTVTEQESDDGETGTGSDTGDQGDGGTTA